MSTVPRRPLARALAGALLAALAGCGDEPAPGADAVSPVLAVHDLQTALRPLAPGSGPLEQGEWHARRKATLERLRAAGPAVGRAAWEAYQSDADAPVEVRIGLLDVAAHSVPDATREHLVELVTRFGPDLALRRAACELLAASAPETAVETLEPILLRRVRKETYPPEDKMLAALLAARRALGQDPVEVLASIATDQHQADEARTLALRELSGTDSPRGRAALRELLVESGNGYLRRVAAQSLLESLPRPELCALLQQVLEREADIDFQIFLARMQEASCR